MFKVFRFICYENINENQNKKTNKKNQKYSKWSKIERGKWGENQLFLLSFPLLDEIIPKTKSKQNLLLLFVSREIKYANGGNAAPKGRVGFSQPHTPISPLRQWKA